MADGGNSSTEVTSSPMCQVENQDQLSLVYETFTMISGIL